MKPVKAHRATLSTSPQWNNRTPRSQTGTADTSVVLDCMVICLSFRLSGRRYTRKPKVSGVYRAPGWRAAARKTKAIPGFRRKTGISDAVGRLAAGDHAAHQVLAVRQA